RKIATDNLTGSAVTILESNLLAGTCARVCPVEELCEGACVLGEDHKPIEIGRLQRHAMDHLFLKELQPLEPEPANGKRVAVVGSGPSGLSCAGQLALEGFEVTVYEKADLPGGLSTYGIVVLREPIRVSLEEVAYIESLGVEVRTGVEVGKDISPAELLEGYDAVFLSVGLGRVPQLGIEGEDAAGVTEALGFIAETKLAEKDGLANLKDIELGSHIAVIGAGNTAIDAATIARRLGAERVTIVYRRTDREMSAYDHEYEFAKSEGVEFRFLSQPVRVLTEGGTVSGLECVRTELTDGGLREIPGSNFVLDCDQVIKAIGQQKLTGVLDEFGIEHERGYALVDGSMRTSNSKVFAGGDCVRLQGDATTVAAVQDGKLAARYISGWLLEQQPVQGERRMDGEKWLT
ncbi:MAG TPA: NAD(P)-dependent oxidoreductase, partial [Deinococcales bacterium]|nr:NAD(P)-dependent oxidoreductase [Deinococcales bacterium]